MRQNIAVKILFFFFFIKQNALKPEGSCVNQAQETDQILKAINLNILCLSH